jgi:hypothetical protein
MEPPSKLVETLIPERGSSKAISKLSDDDKMRANARNIARRKLLKMTSDSLIRKTPEDCGDCITIIMGGQDDPAVLEVQIS